MLASLYSIWHRDALGNWQHRTYLHSYLLVGIIILGDREPAYMWWCLSKLIVTLTLPA